MNFFLAAEFGVVRLVYRLLAWLTCYRLVYLAQSVIHPVDCRFQGSG